MYEISQKIINCLTSNQIEDIFIINKLKIQGFRVKGPSNPVKTQRMKTILIKNPDLEKILKKTAEVNKSQRNKDYTWALVETLDLELVKKKIEETDIGEVTYALIDAEKFELLEEIIIPQTEEINESKEATVENQTSGTQSDRIEAKVTDLRFIVRNLEEKNKELGKKINQIREVSIRLNQENETLKFKNKELKNNLVELIEKYNQTNKTLDLTNNKICKLENDVTKLELEKQSIMLEMKQMSKVNILFYGTNVYRRYIDTKVSKMEILNYEYLYEIDGTEDYSFYQKLIVLKFTLTTLELEDLLKQRFLRYFGELRNLIFIESFEELNEYIEKVGTYNE